MKTDIVQVVRDDHGTVPEGQWTRFFRRLMRKPGALASIFILSVILFLALFGEAIAPYDFSKQDYTAINQGSSAAHWLGTDDLGRDILSRLMSGARVTLFAPIVAVFVGAAVGIPIGLLAGYFGRWFDWLTARMADALFAIPGILLAMAVIAARGPSTWNAMLAIGLLFAPRLFRVVRSEVVSLKVAVFVEAAVTIGAGNFKIIRSHIVPNMMGTLIVQCTLLLAYGVLAEAALSFFGLSVQPPGASWGVVLRRSFDSISHSPIEMLWPGICIMALIWSFQTLGDAMRDSLGKETRRG